MRVSVVMTTYNGQRYLVEQLQSIAEQTVAPDEVLIFDDRSNDDTIEIIGDFIKSNGLDWNLIINEQNYGWKKNFMQGISRATGDIIFLSDQDDIWGKKKIEYMTNALDNNPNEDLVLCQYIETPENVEEYIHAQEFIEPDSRYEKFPVDASTIKNIRPGCTYAFRKSFFDSIVDAWCEGLPHDLLIYMAAWMKGSIVQCNGKLHCFRRHEGANSIKSTEYRADIRYERLAQQFFAYEKILPLVEMNNQRNKDLGKWLSLRKEVLKNRNAVAVIRLLGYLGYYRSVKTWAVDFLTLFAKR